MERYPEKSTDEVIEIINSFERAEIIKNFVYEAMENYNKKTKSLPEQIIIYRDGTGSLSMT